MLEEEFSAEVKMRLNKMGIRIKPCSKCGRDIVFLETTRGKYMPTTLELKSHFADCRAADEFRKVKE